MLLAHYLFKKNLLLIFESIKILEIKISSLLLSFFLTIDLYFLIPELILLTGITRKEAKAEA